MIEILNINPVQKGNLLATCDVHIIPWKTTLVDVKIFERGATRWVNLPSSEFTTREGEKKYKELVTFDTDAIKNRFKAQVMSAIDKFLDANPEMKPEDVVKQDEPLPW